MFEQVLENSTKFEILGVVNFKMNPLYMIFHIFVALFTMNIFEISCRQLKVEQKNDCRSMARLPDSARQISKLLSPALYKTEIMTPLHLLDIIKRH